MQTTFTRPTSSSRTTIGFLIAELANRQHGIVTYDQLLNLGLSKSAIYNLCKYGHIYRVHHRVFSVGCLPTSTHAKLFAAVAAVDGPAAISHLTAANLLNISRWKCREINMIANRKVRDFDTISVHRRSHLLPGDIQIVEGICVTSIAQTALDLSEPFTAHQVANLLYRSAYHGLYTLAELEEIIGRHVRHPHVATLRDAVALYESGSAGTRSLLEDRFLKVIFDAKFPIPLVNTHVDALSEMLEVDFFWPKFGLIIEMDGPPHLLAPNQKIDARRSKSLTDAGFHVVRIKQHEMHAGLSVVSGYLRNRGV